MALERAENNEPLQRAAGDVGQADYNAERIFDLGQAIALLETYEATPCPRGYDDDTFKIVGAYSDETHHKDMAETTAEELLENRAIEIYNLWSDQDGWVPWVERGNSDKQYEARKEACLEDQNRKREALGLPAATGDEPVGYIGVDPAFGSDKTTAFQSFCTVSIAQSLGVNHMGEVEIESWIRQNAPSGFVVKSITVGHAEYVRDVVYERIENNDALVEIMDKAIVDSYVEDDLGELDPTKACGLDGETCESCQ